MNRAATKLELFEERVEIQVENDKISRGDADELLTVVQFDNDGGDFDILRQAVLTTGNITLLNRFSGAFTVFAPTDKAFRNLAENLGGDGSTEAAAFESIVSAATDLGDGDPIPVIDTILQGHIVRGQRVQQWLTRTDYQIGDAVEFNGDIFVAEENHSSGNQFDRSRWNESRFSEFRDSPQQSLSFREVVRTDGIETFGGANVTLDGRFIRDAEPNLPDARINRGRSDIPTRNGTIHVINEVIIPVDIIDGPTITGIVAESGGEFDNDGSDFDILLNAINTVDDANTDPDVANIADVLNDPEADFTTFAPRDSAFIEFARDLGFTGSDEAEAFDVIATALTNEDGDPAPLRNVLLYHVSAGSQTRSQIVGQDSVDTLLGTTITPDGRELIDGDDDLANPNIIASRSDILAENGLVHVIDRVLIPSNLETQDTIGAIVAASGGEFDGDRSDFDILLRAVETAGLTDTLNDPNQSLTVFAPTDNAFITFARELGYNGVDELGSWNTIVDTLTTLGNGDPIPLLTDVLTYHVASGESSIATIRDRGSVTTLQGGSFLVRNRLIDADPDFENAGISDSRSDMLAENGLVHVINRVLLPIDL